MAGGGCLTWQRLAAVQDKFCIRFVLHHEESFNLARRPGRG